jgi:hypothetical protein
MRWRSFRHGLAIGVAWTALVVGMYCAKVEHVMAQRTSAAPASSARRSWDTYSDTWVATDALGRSLPGYDQVGPPRKDRYVGVFYFLWHGAHVNGGPYDISKILRQDPDAMQKPDSPLWGPLGANHHWGESLFGYYLSDDEYVLRKHAQMLSDAGVDVIIFDVTNGFTYKPSYMALLKTFSEVRAAGGKTPQVAFLCPFGAPEKVVKELYADLYEPGLYRDLWFRWEGKPLILADPLLLAGGEGSIAQNTPAPILPGHTLGQSFTVDRPLEAVGGRFPTFATRGAAITLSLFRDGPRGKRVATKRFADVPDNAWLALTLKSPLPPGAYYLEASQPTGRIGWWSHTDDVFAGGQALADGAPSGGDRTLQIVTAGGRFAALRGFFTFRKPQPDYFQGPTAPNMWSWLEVYPQHVFRNAEGEKEQMSVGTAQNAIGNRLGTLSDPGARGRNYHDGANDPRPDAVLYGYNAAEQWERALKEDPKFIFVTGWNEWFAARYNEFLGVHAPVMFVDTFNQINSRDIEPMRGGHGDNYYYQMAAYIRRYKGVRKPPAAGPVKTIDISGDFHQWDDVRPEFRDDVGDAAMRNHPGWNHFTQYVNTTGRNDFVALKAARDAKFLYFYARTKDAITPHTDPHWMMLFLNTDGNPQTGWHGYDYVLNRVGASAGSAVLERSLGGWNWQRVAEVRYRVASNEIMVAIPRSALGLNDRAKPLSIDFKWADNIQRDDDVFEFTVNGDSAPNGRFSYRYTAPN